MSSSMVAAARATKPPYLACGVPRKEQAPYRPYGTARDLFYCKRPEVVLSGPAGTGKSRACLEKLFLCACKYAGMRALMVRKTREALTQGAMVTFEQKVLPEGSAVYYHTTDHEYRFPNGSVIVVGGLDKSSKVMSTEYDMVYVQEATELTEDDWESLSTRLRNGVMPYQQLLGDCNPSAPTHWLLGRATRGATLMYESRHEDNPSVTPEYLAKLDALTGVRYKRLRLGEWAATEGQVYEEWNPAAHVIDRFDIPDSWPRYRSIDFGFTNPFVCLWLAADNDGRLYLYRELYQTQTLVSVLAKEITRLSAGERYQWTVSDHDAEDRETLHANGIRTIAANKEVSPGIQDVQARLKRAGDGKPRLFVFRDALVKPDASLIDNRLPVCTADEFPEYAWAVKPNTGGQMKEEPVKKNDHGLDALRYAVHYLDGARRNVEWA